MRITCLSFVAILFCLRITGQNEDKLNYRPLRTDTSSLQVYLLEDASDNPKKICSSCVYHWLKAGQIQQTRGGFDGKLLHGSYTEYFVNGDLREKGIFVKGLKSGEWRTWYQNGELYKITLFKKGLRDGKEEVFDVDGKLKQVNHYKTGQLHGQQISYADSIPTISYYKNGMLQVKEMKKSRSPELELTQKSQNSKSHNREEKNKTEKKRTEKNKKEKSTEKKDKALKEETPAMENPEGEKK